jgi:hypothetical protein
LSHQAKGAAGTRMEIGARRAVGSHDFFCTREQIASDRAVLRHAR